MTYDFSKWEEQILEAISNEVSVNSWSAVKGRPSFSTVMRWQADNEAFAIKCARAREAAGESSACRQNDVITGVLDGSIPPEIARVALSGLQWRASKLASKRYGDKLAIAGDAANPIALSIEVDFAANKDNPT